MFEFQGITARHHLKQRSNDDENTGKFVLKVFPTPYFIANITIGTKSLIGKSVPGSGKDTNKKTPFGDMKNTLASHPPATPSNKNTQAPIKSMFKSFATPKLSSSSTPMSFKSDLKPLQQPDHRYVFDANDLPLQPVDFSKCWAQSIVPSDSDLNKLFAPTEFLEDEIDVPKAPQITSPIMEESPMPDWSDFDQLPPIDDFDLQDTLDVYF